MQKKWKKMGKSSYLKRHTQNGVWREGKNGSNKIKYKLLTMETDK